MACYKPRFSDAAGEYHEKMFPGCVSDFIRTDPEFIERFDELLGVGGGGGCRPPPPPGGHRARGAGGGAGG
jgi:hypothetical protein